VTGKAGDEMTDVFNNLQAQQSATTCQTRRKAERLEKSVGVWMTNAMADALVSASKAHRRNISDYIRLTLEGQLQRDGFLP
jgi:hypothetical protein